MEIAACSLRIPAADGFALAADVFAPASGESRAVVVISSATAVRRAFYEDFARWLAARGFTVLIYDYRGVGDSRPRSLRGFTARLRDWADLDLTGVLRYARVTYQPRALLLVGHSAGGQLAGLSPENAHLAGVLLLAAGSGYWGLWPRPERYRLALVWSVILPAAVKLFGYLPGRLGVGQDLPAGVATEWARWCRHPHHLVSEDAAHRRESFSRMKGALFTLSFSDDPYAPQGAVDWLADLYVRARPHKRHHLHPGELGGTPIGHFGFFRETFKETLWREAADWLEQVAGAAGAQLGPAGDRAGRTLVA